VVAAYTLRELPAETYQLADAPVFSLTRQHAISVPNGTREGLPIGRQLAG
jgi:Asp-tRNA(Asn)/Glu-tRNA(Gln) amidotransferase A subunit family amidase